MTLPLAEGLTFGVQTIYRRTEPADTPWVPPQQDGREVVELVERLGFDYIWFCDKQSFAIHIIDTLVKLAHAS